MDKSLFNEYDKHFKQMGSIKLNESRNLNFQTVKYRNDCCRDEKKKEKWNEIIQMKFRWCGTVRKKNMFSTYS